MRTGHEARCTSVVDSPHEPASAQRVVVETVETTIGRRCHRCIAARRRRMETNLQIPIVLMPGIVAPPVAGCAPRAGSGQHFSTQSLNKNASGPAVMQVECGGNGRAENSKTRRGFRIVTLPIGTDN